MTTLAILLATLGGILVLVGLVGGGFTFSGSVMPRVGKFARVPCFIVGAILLIAGISIAVSSQVSPASTTATGTVVVPQGSSYDYVFQVPSLSSTVTAELSNGQSVQIQCTVQGEAVSDNGDTSSLWDKTDTGYIPDVNVYTGTDQPTMPNC
jgi:hypothetical protein